MKDKSLHVLIIDDSKDDVLLIIRALKKGGYHAVYERLVTAATMKKALQEKQWDIILCDYRMPRFNAPSAIAMLKESNMDIPIIIISGVIGEETAVECMRLGARDYIMKDNLARLCPAITRELEYAKLRKMQKQSEEELRKSEVKFKHLVSWVPGMIYQFTMRPDGTTCLPFASETIRDFYGCSPEDVRENLSPIIKVILPKDLDKFSSSIQYSAKNMADWSCEYRVQVPGRPIRWMLGHSTPEKLADGSVTWHGLNTDITESKQAEEALRNSHRRLDEIIDFLPDATFVINLEGKIITWNRSAENVTGSSKADMVGKGNYEYAIPFYGERRPILIDLVLQPDDVFERTHYDNVSRQGDTLYSEIYFPKAYRGRGAFFWGKASKLRDTSGHIIGAIETFRDITESKRAEEALRNSHRRLDDIIDFLPDATFVIDIEGKVITWNKSIEMITVVSKADMVGKGDYEYAIPFYGERRPILIDLVLQPENFFEKSHYENVYRQGDTLYAESFLPKAYGGKGAFMWGTASKLRDAAGNIIGAIESVRDITERRTMEDELKLFAENLEDANIALRVLMNRRDKDQKEFEEKLQVNINDLVVPYLKKLRNGNLDDRNQNYVGVLEHNLGDILSPFMRNFQSAHKNLTPREIQIVDLIKQGKDTKEIADMLNASISTITTHRNNIRKKLNLINSKINLRSHILSCK